MTRIGKYLSVDRMERAPNRKTDRWCIFANSGVVLGDVEWFGRWRQYCFNPAPSTTFNSGCLQDLAKFLAEANHRHRAAIRTGP
jgi:hypothetical protein